MRGIHSFGFSYSFVCGFRLMRGTRQKDEPIGDLEVLDLPFVVLRLINLSTAGAVF